MKFLIMTDIEGVSGVTTFPQAENSEFGRRMMMHDLMAVIKGIRQNGDHQIVIYDMHTDGRNVDIEMLNNDVNCRNIPVVMGKPISGEVYRGIGGDYDGLFLLGLHSMQNVSGALLAHTYLREYDSISINGKTYGEIGIEALLAGEQNIPLIFVSGDDIGCAEAKSLNEDIVTAVVKKSIGDTQALCYSLAYTEDVLIAKASEAVEKADRIRAIVPDEEVKIKIRFSNCRYLDVMKSIYPDHFIDDYTLLLGGAGMLNTWSRYLLMEQEMIKETKY